MKLTKDVVEVLKYHGYITCIESTETFLKHFNTVEELGAAGFITDRGVDDFLKSIFDENGVNRSAEVGEDELEKQAVIEPKPINPEPIEPEVVTPEPINPEPINPEPVMTEPVEPENGPTDIQNPEPTPETPTSEPEKEPEPTPEPVEEKPKPKKTTTKKTSKKES